jgi:hypothetical protein
MATSTKTTAYAPRVWIKKDCAGLQAELEIAVEEQEAFHDTVVSDTQHLYDLAYATPGYVEVNATTLPNLAEVTNRINNLGGGLSRWKFTVVTSGTVITLPFTVTPSKTRVWVNGVPMNATIASGTVTFATALNVGDLVTVRSYG